MSEAELIQENVWLIYSVFLAVLVAFSVWSFVKNRGKIRVRIKTPLGEQIKWVKPEPDNKTLVIEKKPKWTVTFTNASVVLTKDKWGRTIRNVDVMYGSPRAIEYDFTGNKVEMPLLTKKDAYEINRLDALKLRYGRMPKLPTPTAIWVVLALNIIILVVLLLLMRGVRVV